jgi:biopolymer transport protein ExbD
MMRLARSRSLPTASLSLTSLIDAFSILVIYLIIVTQEGVFDVEVFEHIQAPQTQSAKMLDQETAVIEVVGHDLRYQGHTLVASDLQSMKEAKKKIALLAPKEESFEIVEQALRKLQNMGVDSIDLLTENAL